MEGMTHIKRAKTLTYLWIKAHHLLWELKVVENCQDHDVHWQVTTNKGSDLL